MYLNSIFLLLSSLNLIIQCSSYKLQHADEYQPQKQYEKSSLILDDDEFYVEVKTNFLLISLKFVTSYPRHRIVYYDPGIRIELSCIHKHRHNRDSRHHQPVSSVSDSSTILQWMDTNGNLACQEKSLNEMKLSIVPDEADNGTKYTCAALEQRSDIKSSDIKRIHIILHRSTYNRTNSDTRIVKPGHEVKMYYTRWSHIASPCNGTMSSLNTPKTRINTNQILNIEEIGNGTSVFCDDYAYTYMTNVDEPYCLRYINIYTYYLKYNNETTEVSTTLSTSTTHGPSVAVMGGLVGIAVLALCIILICYKKKSRQNKRQTEPVVYAELDHIHYAKIIGYLVPNSDPVLKRHINHFEPEEPIYWEIE